MTLECESKRKAAVFSFLFMPDSCQEVMVSSKIYRLG